MPTPEAGVTYRFGEVVLDVPAWELRRNRTFAAGASRSTGRAATGWPATGTAVSVRFLAADLAEAAAPDLRETGTWYDDVAASWRRRTPRFCAAVPAGTSRNVCPKKRSTGGVSGAMIRGVICAVSRAMKEPVG
jgi:hypothetical protein